MSVLVYSTPTCPWCHKVKDYLKERNIAFDDVDVSLDAARVDEMFKKSGQMGVPVIDINGTIIVGFDQLAIDEALL
jgi:glutaredoxin-like YruB-family protein